MTTITAILDVIDERSRQAETENLRTVRKLLHAFVDSEVSRGRKTFLFDPFAVKWVDDNLAVAQNLKSIIPCIFIENFLDSYEHQTKILDELTGGEYNCQPDLGGRTMTLRHFNEIMALILPMPYDTFAPTAVGVMVDQKYALANLYMTMEDLGMFPPSFFKAEALLQEALSDDVDIERFLFRDGSGGGGGGGGGGGADRHSYDAAMSLLKLDGLYLTGTSAALNHMGYSSMSLPLEFGTVDLVQSATDIFELLSRHGKVMVRGAPVYYPGGMWFLSSAVVVLDGVLIALVHDTIRFYSHYAWEKELFPLSILNQLCLSAWMLERKGSQKARWVYTILRTYRAFLLTPQGAERYAAQKEKYLATGTKYMSHSLAHRSRSNFKPLAN